MSTGHVSRSAVLHNNVHKYKNTRLNLSQKADWPKLVRVRGGGREKMGGKSQKSAKSPVRSLRSPPSPFILVIIFIVSIAQVQNVEERGWVCMSQKLPNERPRNVPSDDDIRGGGTHNSYSQVFLAVVLPLLSSEACLFPPCFC